MHLCLKIEYHILININLKNKNKYYSTDISYYLFTKASM